ncbi:unnamed protein product [Rhizophagus irregularis]|nr:unnamed protein product [Rhizophagus irregularis]CAB5361005.1 unnamed protein product [Rhizophagus irregularis]
MSFHHFFLVLLALRVRFSVLLTCRDSTDFFGDNIPTVIFRQFHVHDRFFAAFLFKFFHIFLTCDISMSFFPDI